MSAESEPLEAYYASDTLVGLIRSGYTLLRARRVKPRSGKLPLRSQLGNLADHALYTILIAVTAFFLDAYQRMRSLLTGKPRAHPQGSWQYYLQTGLREDLAHHTNETTGYQDTRPTAASPLDDLTAWVMAVIQFIWNYEDLMGAIWDEWTLLRLVQQAAQEEGLSHDDLFVRLQRQWEVVRSYSPPLNGTYADVRRAAFMDFISPRLAALSDDRCASVIQQHQKLAAAERQKFQNQMSLLMNIQPGRYKDTRQPIPLWNACIGLIVGGSYYLIDVADHNEEGLPLVYGQAGRQHPLRVANGHLVTQSGHRVEFDGVHCRRKDTGELVGCLDMASASRVKGKLRHILEHHAPPPDHEPIDILLAETSRGSQARLRALLPRRTQEALHQLARAPVIINWDEQPREKTLAELRRAQRGVGDHALTIMRTASSTIFDQSHIFFDGTWSLAMAEVLTNTAIRWCERCITITPIEAPPTGWLELEASPLFLREAANRRQKPEISAETTIWDISSILSLRRLLSRTGTRLTVNDLLVITRIFHAAHYRPSPGIQEEIEGLREQARTPAEQRAVQAIDRSLQRGWRQNPALLIPVDASPADPHERIFPIAFRNLADNLVWIWDDTWDAYQEYRRHEPPDTAEGMAAFQDFARKRTLLVGNLRAFSYILDASKAVAMRGDSINLAILKLLVGLPLWLQHLLKEIPEQFPVLNEIIRGDEVYSNVGRVTRGSSLTRFMTAKDDGNTKVLAWGVMTDDEGRLIVTMRDFRPHVEPLVSAGRIDLAYGLAQDYVVSYTADLIGLVARLSAMLQVKAPLQNADNR